MSLPSPFSVEYRLSRSFRLSSSRLHSKLPANRPSWSLVEGELIKRTVTAPPKFDARSCEPWAPLIRAEVFKIFSVMFIVFCLISGAFAVYFYKQYTTLLDLKPRRQIFQNNSPVTLTTEGRTR
jgi:hypothetical protein